MFTLVFSLSVMHSIGFEKMYLPSHYHREQLTASNIPMLTYLFLLSSPGICDLFTGSIVSSFPECHEDEIKHCLAFKGWFLSFSNIYSI